MYCFSSIRLPGLSLSEPASFISSSTLRPMRPPRLDPSRDIARSLAASCVTQTVGHNRTNVVDVASREEPLNSPASHRVRKIRIFKGARRRKTHMLDPLAPPLARKERGTFVRKDQNSRRNLAIQSSAPT
ncbi:hypothetical protein AOLI_G00245720 [Acnodon oligacanthus]